MNRASEYGNATGVTIGREYFNNSTHQTLMEWAILPYDNSQGSSPPPAIRALSSLTAADVSVASSPAVPARLSPRTSRTRRTSSGFCRASRPTGFLTPPLPSHGLGAATSTRTTSGTLARRLEVTSRSLLLLLRILLPPSRSFNGLVVGVDGYFDWWTAV